VAGRSAKNRSRSGDQSNKKAQQAQPPNDMFLGKHAQFQTVKQKANKQPTPVD